MDGVMFQRKRTGSVLCPSCGQLVGVNDRACLMCGRPRPGLFGFTGIAAALARGEWFAPLVLWACGALYLASLAVDPAGIEGLLSPSMGSLVLFGASGAAPVFESGRFWTPLSAGWLHGNVLHIVFNMMWVRDLAPLTAHLYGPARTAIIYTVASVAGFLASSVAGLLPALGVLRGAAVTIGASASVFGLMGAVLYAGQRGGGRLLREQAKIWALGGIIFGFVMPGIDNWAHAGGFAGGYLAARWLDPLEPERGDHVILALLCLGLSLGAVLLSVATGLSFGREGN